MPLRSGNRALIRDINRHLVLNFIKNRGPLSRADVTALSNLSQSTVTNITRHLLEMGLIREVAVGTSTGGRPPIMLEIDPGGGYALGLKLMPTSATLAMTDLFGDVVEHASVELNGSSSVEVYVDELVATIHNFLLELSVPDERLMGVGLGLPGFIDFRRGVCVHSPLFEGREIPLAEILEQRLDIGVLMDNNVTTLTLYELLFGNRQGGGDMAVITVGQGVGMGLAMNGRLLRGSRGGAGELGHIPMVGDGPLCSCGNRGCLEALICDAALIAQAQSAGLPVTTGQELYEMAARNDSDALRIYAEAGRWLGRGLATVVNLINPARITISGESAPGFRLADAVIREEMFRHIFNGLGDKLDIVIEPIEDYSWAQGAASLVLDEFFSPPIY